MPPPPALPSETRSSSDLASSTSWRSLPLAPPTLPSEMRSASDLPSSRIFAVYKILHERLQLSTQDCESAWLASSRMPTERMLPFFYLFNVLRGQVFTRVLKLFPQPILHECEDRTLEELRVATINVHRLELQQVFGKMLERLHRNQATTCWNSFSRLRVSLRPGSFCNASDSTLLNLPPTGPRKRT